MLGGTGGSGGRFPEGVEAIYLDDRGDACFGYAVTLAWADGSEWRGDAPCGE